MSEERLPAARREPTPGRGLPASVQRYLHTTGLLPRLLAAEALVFALIFAGSVLLVDQFTNSLRAGATNGWYLLANSLGSALNLTLDNTISTLEENAGSYRTAVRAGRPAEAQATLDRIAAHSQLFTGGVLAVDRQHRVRAADRDHANLVGDDLSASWPPAASTQRVLAWSFRHAGALEAPSPSSGGGGSAGPTSGSSGGAPMVALAVPLGPTSDDGDLVGLIAAEQSTITINRILAMAVKLGKSGHADLVDRDCRTLFSTEPSHLLTLGEHPTFCRHMFLQGQPGIGEAATEAADGGIIGAPHVMAFIPLTTLPWALEVGTSTREAYALADRLQVDSLTFLAAFIGLAFLATIVVGRQILAPVRALSVAASRVAEGEPSGGIRIPWGGEIGELARSLETMRVRLAGWAATLQEQVEQRTHELEARNRDLSALYESLQRKEAQRQDLLGRLLTAQEDERRRVSRELHDGIGQALWALTLNLERLQARADYPEDVRQEIASLGHLAEDSLRDLRRLTVALRPAVLDDLGLLPALRRYAELYLDEAGVAYTIAEQGLERRLDPFLETIVYRVVQEAINNVARHSQASRVQIELRASGSELVATVADNGRGFEPTTVGQGVGLEGMQERALLAGAQFRIESRPGHGTTVVLNVPLPQREDDEYQKHLGS